MTNTRQTAEHILGPLMAEDEVLGMLSDALRVDDAGVWPGVDGPWLWLPAMELDSSGVNLANTPGLPVPFDAIDLASFMVSGVGIWIREFYGPIDGGPDPDRLLHMHPHANIAQEALASAYAALRTAVSAVGAEPDTNAPEWAEWRRAMVCKLHEMHQSLPSAKPASEPAELAATNAELAALKASKRKEAGTLPRVGQNEQQRRLLLLRELGGSIKRNHLGEWQITRIGLLEKRERADKRDRCSTKTIRADLIKAAEIKAQ